jgi:hypothetical protein
MMQNAIHIIKNAPLAEDRIFVMGAELVERPIGDVLAAL